MLAKNENLFNVEAAAAANKYTENEILITTDMLEKHISGEVERPEIQKSH